MQHIHSPIMYRHSFIISTMKFPGDYGLDTYELHFLKYVIEDIRLMREYTHDPSYTGRLEIRFDKEWGTECGGFTDKDATVACRNLGYE